MADTDTERSEPARSRAVPVLAAALVVALALAAAFAVVWRQAAETSSEEVSEFLDSERADAEDVAREVVTLLINYDSTNLARRAERILPLATGSFRDQYERLIQEGLGKALEAAAASSRGQILEGPDVTFASPSEAIALVRTTQTTQSDDNPGGRTFLYVMKLTMVKVEASGWKADRVEILSQQSA